MIEYLEIGVISTIIGLVAFTQGYRRKEALDMDFVMEAYLKGFEVGVNASAEIADSKNTDEKKLQIRGN